MAEQFLPIEGVRKVNYTKVRREAIIESNELNTSHPCCKGNGACCVRNIPVTPDDRKVIIRGIEDGSIKKSVIEMAKKNAQDAERTTCVFLEEGKCSIYRHRPIICAATGTGGMPSIPGSVESAIKQFRKTGKDPGIPVEQTSSSMCESCHQQLSSRRARFSTVSMLHYQDVMATFPMGGYSYMPTVVKNLPVPRK